MDTTVLNAALEGLALVLSWPYILYPVAGTLLAMVFSASPRLLRTNRSAVAATRAEIELASRTGIICAAARAAPRAKPMPT